MILATTWCATGLAAFAGRPVDPASPDTAEKTGEQANPSLPAVAPGARTQNVTVNLINRLVEKKILTPEEAAEMIKGAETDAAAARQEVQATRNEVARTQALLQQIPVTAPAPENVPGLDAALIASDDAVRVTYIPENLKAEMREQIKSEVMAQARSENWASPRSMPDWLPRFRFNGDLRVRGEGDFYPSGNDNTGAFPNFNAINTGSPYDTTGTSFAPQLNVDRQRERLKLRARFGVDVDLEEGFTAGFRLGTGDTSTPVSENQGLGVANNGQGGNFSKYAIWLDRAFLQYDAGKDPDRHLMFTTGRFNNPFFGTTMIWVDDMGFDGLAVKGRYRIAKGVTTFLTAGAFPVFNTDLNFSSIQPAKFHSTDKWLYGVQFGADIKPGKDFDAKVAGALYYFDGVAGQLSSPFTPTTSADQGDTDNLRPSFAQKGNTYMALRNITPNVLNNFGTINQWQYYGLATGFKELTLTGQLNYNGFEPFQVSLTGEFVRNLAFDKKAIETRAVNNRGASTSSSSLGSFDGGNTGWTVNFRVGHAALAKRGDWNASLGYRYLESDAVVDGFNDNDFGGGGTNLKGYTLGANYSLSSRVWLGMKWLSATSIAGSPFKSDTLWFDINAKF